MRLLLIRHGQTPANVRGELDTAAPGPGLTPLGHAQAAAIPSALAGEQIDAIYVSTLVRTHLTAAPLAAARSLAPVELSGTHEIDAGDHEMATTHEAYRVYLETCMAWGTGDRDRVMPGAFDGNEFFARFDASVAQASTVGTAVVFSHGAAMRVWVAGSATNLDDVAPSFKELDNTALVELEGSPAEGWRLVRWGTEPLGGAILDDETAEDPTGEGIDEALA